MTTIVVITGILLKEGKNLKNRVVLYFKGLIYEDTNHWGVYLDDNNLILTPLGSKYCNDTKLVGGKVYNLTKLIKSGFLVPDGYVLTTKAFDVFTSRNPSVFDLLNYNRSNEQDLVMPLEVETALKKVLERKLGKLIVRSSSISEDSRTLSFAGLYESVPNISSYEELKKAVIHCWLSVFSERVISYIKSAGISAQPKIALLIQRFIEPESAGVVFSINPKNGESDEVVINSVKGFAGDLLAGKQEGDEWIYKNGGAICIQEPYKSLTLGQVKEISKLAKKIEGYFSEPQDIEWAIKNGYIYIIQSRPITQIEGKQKDYYFRNISISRDLILLYPYQQKPLDFSFLKEIMETSQYSVSSLYGWPYSLGLRRIRNFTYIEDKSAIKPEEVPLEFQQNIYFAMDSITGKIKKMIRKAYLIATKILNNSEETVTRQELLDAFEENWIRWKDIFDLHYLIAYFSQAEIENFIYFIKGELENKKISQNDIYNLLSGNGNTQTRINNELRKIGYLLSKKIDTLEIVEKLNDDQIISMLESLENEIYILFEKLLKKYGRLMYSLNVSSESWIENPVPLLRLIIGYAKRSNNKLYNVSENSKHKIELLEYIEKKIENDKKKKETFKVRISKAVYCNRALQDRDVLIVNPALYSAHKFFLKIGNSLSVSNQIGDKRDVFYLFPNEIREGLLFPNFDLKDTVERRKFEELFWLQITPPSKISKSPTIEETLNNQEIYGVGISGGKIKARALLVTDFYDASKKLLNIKEKKILIAHDFDLSWTPLFTMAGGVVTEINFGLLSHTAVLAREYGIPAVAGVRGIMKAVKDGDLLEIDGDTGKIQIFKS